MTFPIIGIFIHDEINIARVCINQCSTLHNVQTIVLMLINAHDSALPGGLGEDLTSDPASPPLAPLSHVNHVGLGLLVQHGRMSGDGLSSWTAGVYHVGLGMP